MNPTEKHQFFAAMNPYLHSYAWRIIYEYAIAPPSPWSKPYCHTCTDPSEFPKMREIEKDNDWQVTLLPDRFLIWHKGIVKTETPIQSEQPYARYSAKPCIGLSDSIVVITWCWSKKEGPQRYPYTWIWLIDRGVGFTAKCRVYDIYGDWLLVGPKKASMHNPIRSVVCKITTEERANQFVLRSHGSRPIKCDQELCSRLKELTKPSQLPNQTQ